MDVHVHAINIALKYKYICRGGCTGACNELLKYKYNYRGGCNTGARVGVGRVRAVPGIQIQIQIQIQIRRWI